MGQESRSQDVFLWSPSPWLPTSLMNICRKEERHPHPPGQGEGKVPLYMKVLMKPIKMIAWFDEDGVPTPVRYNMRAEDQANITIRIDRIIQKKEEKLAGNRMLIFTCQSVINGLEKRYEIKYELSTCKWFLYKM